MNFFEKAVKSIGTWFEGIAESIPSIISAIISIVLVLIASKIIIVLLKKMLKTALLRKTKSKHGDPLKQKTLFTLLSSAIKYVIYFIAVVSILNIIGLGITASSLLATAGIGGIALSLGAQSFIKDIVNGAFILFENQYSVGDYINIGSVTGTVESVSIRSTELRAASGELYFIPNGTINVVTNYSRGSMLALADVEIAYESDIDKALESMKRAADLFAKDNETIIEGPSVLGVVNLGESGVGLRMSCRVKPLTNAAAQREMLKLIKQCFDEDGITIPYPHIVYISKEG